MKPSLGRAVLLIIMLCAIVECRPMQAPYNAGSPVIDSRGSSAGEYFVEDGLFNVQDTPGSKANMEYIRTVRTQNTNTGLQRLVGTSRIIRDVSRSKRSVNQHLEDKKLDVPNTSSQADQQYISSADARQNPTERVKIEIIERPKELRIYVNKSPSNKQSHTDAGKKGLKKLQREILDVAKLRSTDEATFNKDRDAKFSATKEIYSDDDDEISGQDGSGDALNFHDTLSLLSKDHAPDHKPAKHRHAHQKKKFSDGADVGGVGLLWSLVVIAFVLAVVSMVFLTRSCCSGKTPDVELKSVNLEKSSKLMSSDQSALKEARIQVGKRKSQENRKVLRRLSADQGASTVNEELALACSVISPTIETRQKNSGALHTRACIRAATSHSRRNSSFQEDLEKARCEFVNAPARFAKLVSLAGDEKETEAVQDSDSEAVETRDSPVVINLQ